MKFLCFRQRRRRQIFPTSLWYMPDQQWQHIGEIQSTSAYRDIHHRIALPLMTASGIVNRVRAGNAFATFRGVKTLITCARAGDENRNMTNAVIVESGVIVDVDDRGIRAATKDRCFVVRETAARYDDLPVSRCSVLPFREWAAWYNMPIGE
jgi:hypothetical protein